MAPLKGSDLVASPTSTAAVSPLPPKPPSAPTLITSPGTAGRCSGLVSKPLSYDEKPFTISAKEGSVYWFVIATHEFKRKT